MATLAVLAFLLAPAAPAAEAQVRAVTVTFTDDKGNPVEGLVPEEVALLENGVARDVTSLQLDRRPLTLALLVDTSAAVSSSYRLTMVDALMSFLGRLPAGSTYALWTTGDRPTKLVDYTDDVSAAAKALKRVAPQGGNTMLDALVAVVNHRHGTTDWMPIDLKLRENLDEAIACYKHYDLLIVNAMFDGMNLVAKEGPLVNEHCGVSLLSENTGAHEELGEFSLSVNPFDVQEQADAIHRALTMSDEEREWRAEGLKSIIRERDPGDWIDDQLRDIEAKRAGRSPAEART